MTRRLFLMFILLLVAPLQARAFSSSAGATWAGTFTRDGADLKVTLRIETGTGAAAAYLSADDLRIVDFPLRAVALQGDRIAFDLTGDTSTTHFEGRMQGDRLSGTFSDNGRPGTFMLARQRASGASECDGRPAEFANGAVRLSGTLVRPRHASRRLPSMLLVHGSGPESRDTGRFLAFALCRSGVAALVYDKRGVGRSGGDWREAGVGDLAGDAVAGLDWLARQPDLDPRRIGVYGHSQGGALAPLIANRSRHVAFLVAGAGAGMPMRDVERFSLWNAVRPQVHGEEDAREAHAYVDRLVDMAANGQGIPAFIADAQRFKERPWFSTAAPPPADSWYWRMSHDILNYDPAREWARVRQPTLLLYGALDERIPVQASVTAIQAAARAAGNKRVHVVILPNATHAFDLVSPGQVWPRVAPGYPGLVVAFASGFRPD